MTPESPTRPPIVKLFHVVAIAEGLSFLLLLGIAMPLKYMAGMPAAVHWVGSIHGFLFVAYVALAGGLFTVAGWPISRLPWVLLASVLPFGTFVLERKWLR